MTRGTLHNALEHVSGDGTDWEYDYFILNKLRQASLLAAEPLQLTQPHGGNNQLQITKEEHYVPQEILDAPFQTVNTYTPGQTSKLPGRPFLAHFTCLDDGLFTNPSPDFDKPWDKAGEALVNTEDFLISDLTPEGTYDFKLYKSTN